MGLGATLAGMKWFLSAVVSVVLGVACARAQLVAEPATIDFGKQGQDQVLVAKVSLINSGKESLQILSVHADCSCTAGTPEKSELAPGERTELAIKTETRSYQGELIRRIVVRTSRGEITVPVKVTVLAYKNWSLSSTMLMLKPSQRREEVKAEMVLTFLDDKPVEITGFDVSEPWVTAEVTRREGKEFGVTVTKKAGAPAGNHQVKMSALTSDAVNPRVEFKAFMPVISAVRVKPSPLVMPVGLVGEETRVKGELLGWDGNLPPRFEATEGVVTLQGTGAEGLLFELAITPKSVGASTQLLRVYAGKELELEVPVIFRVRAGKQR
jgi:hypothetical protein